MLYWIDFSIYLLICFFCFHASVKVLNWCYYADRHHTPFAFWFLFGIGGIKSSLGLWMFFNAIGMPLGYVQPPLWNLVFRIALLAFLALHSYILHYARSADIDMIGLDTNGIKNGNGKHNG